MKKKNICIGLLIAFIIIIIVSWMLYLKKQEKKIPDSNVKSFEKIMDIISSENTTNENILEVGLTEEDSTIENDKKEKKEEDVSINVQKEITSQETKQENKNEQKKEEKPITINKSVDQPTQKKEEKPIQETTKPSMQVQENNNQMKDKETVVKNNTNVETKQDKQEIKKDVFTYAENTDMIGRMKKIIEDNETDDMKEFGYTIKTESSIVNSTNYFSFTEKRVKDKIKYKFGLIQIYARDYYKNGVFQYTECFII